MSMNQVQFQKGLSMAEFMERYGTEAKCHAALVASRWPEGFRCPCCGDEHHSTFVREERQHWQCHRCRRQSTVTAGTVFEATKLPLTRWFLAMHLMTQAHLVLEQILNQWPVSAEQAEKEEGLSVGPTSILT